MIIRKNLNYLFIFILSIIITSTFLIFLPENLKANDNSDYQSFYEPVARNILSGKGYTLNDNTIATLYPPGYPILLALLFGLSKGFSISENSLLSLFQVILIAISVVVIFHLAQKATNKTAALVTGLLWMTYPFVLWLTKQPNSEIPYIAVLYCGCAILFSNCCFQKYNKLPYLLSGLLIGLAILIRPIAIFIPFILTIFLFYSLSNTSGRRRLVLSSAFLIGTFILIVPWEGYIYAKTGKVVLISENSSMAIRGGLVFAVSDDSYKQPVPVPTDVRNLMIEIKDRYNEFTSTTKVVSFLIGKVLSTPAAVFKLFWIKAIRSWYATDRQSYEGYILLLQIPYLMLILTGSLLAWKSGANAKKLMLGIWLLTLSNWGMTILVTSTLRYMVPVIGLQFINIAQVPYFIYSKYEKHRVNQPQAIYQ